MSTITSKSCCMAAAIASQCLAVVPLFAAPVSIDAKSLPPVRTVDERFQSFQIGMSHLTGGNTWRRYDKPGEQGKNEPAESFAAVREARVPADLSNPRLRHLTAALGPLYIRYGGTTSNSVYFQDDDKAALDTAPDGFKSVLTRSGWKSALEFADAVDAKVVTGFTVSHGVRDTAGRWTPAQAEPWVAYTSSIGGGLYAAELYNEPNVAEPGSEEQAQTAAGFGRDIAAFATFMATAAPEVKLAGPGVATLGVPVPVSSLEQTSPAEYMKAVPDGVFDIISYHFYGAIAERCAPEDSPAGISADQALTEDWLARPDKQLLRHLAIRDRYAPGAPVWLTETGAAACGGPRWQPTFLDSFRYLDTLGRTARQGLDAIFTHALISGSNGIIDEQTFMPNANYWAALFWRRTMGTQVLDAGTNPARMHLYAHCQRKQPGGVSLLAINLDAASAQLNVAGPAERYTLTAAELQSGTVLLNGSPLTLTTDYRLPDITTAHEQGKAIDLPPHSISFIEFPEAGNSACK